MSAEEIHQEAAKNATNNVSTFKAAKSEKNKKFLCSFHGENNSHVSKQCFRLHPELKQKTANAELIKEFKTALQGMDDTIDVSTLALNKADDQYFSQPSGPPPIQLTHKSGRRAERCSEALGRPTLGKTDSLR